MASPTASLAADASSKKEYNSCFRSQMRNTQLCKFFQKGKCRYGPSCMFAHNQEELQNPPSLVKTSLCMAFAQGKCPYDADLCPYAHGREELIRTPAFQRKKGRNARAATAAAIQACETASFDGSMSEASAPTLSTSVGLSESIFQSEFDDSNDGSNSVHASEGRSSHLSEEAVEPAQDALVQTPVSSTGHSVDVLAQSIPTLPSGQCAVPYQMVTGSQVLPGSQGTNMPMIFVPVFMMPMPYQQVQSA
mmetsp:Transcript_12865/g.29022  ORF Transcript_12865/g.29022 Transcript_12865/m.29022 type:complete len:249 (-) Transcript_12865:97-843(-)